jgi:CRP-like cAMP-binding protein
MVNKQNAPAGDKFPEQKSEIFAILKRNLLFENIPVTELAELVKHCLLYKTVYKQLIWNHAEEGRREKPGVPLFIIAKGCVKIVNMHEENRLWAIVVPDQLIGEFQLLGDPWPTELAVRTYNKETEIVEIDQKYLLELAKKYPLLYKNLSKTLVEKLTISNSRFSVTAEAKHVLPKLAIFLDKAPDFPRWKKICKTEDNYHSYVIDIFWSCRSMSSVLVCDERGMQNALNTLHKAGAIEMEYLKLEKEKLKGVRAEKGRNFRIIVKDANLLRDFEGER